MIDTNLTVGSSRTLKVISCASGINLSTSCKRSHNSFLGPRRPRFGLSPCWSACSNTESKCCNRRRRGKGFNHDVSDHDWNTRTIPSSVIPEAEDPSRILTPTHLQWKVLRLQHASVNHGAFYDFLGDDLEKVDYVLPFCKHGISWSCW